SWLPSGPLSPGDALEVSRVDAPRRLRLAPLAASHHHGWLTPPRAAARVARGTGAPHAASRRDRSGPRPSLACQAATAWPSPGRGEGQGGARAGVSWHAGGKN